ncbi:MAG: sigma 54-interacting transcriptional regulator [bacterium]|nr:sigma 54-interacting transcriptional regulator [bacterium]
MRIIAATNRDLMHEVEQGRFRRDLYFRLNVYPVAVPALRDHLEDLPALAEHFLVQSCRRLGAEPQPLRRKHIAQLQAYAWPGNVRELQNTMERAAIVSPVRRDELRPGVPAAATAAAARESAAADEVLTGGAAARLRAREHAAGPERRRLAHHRRGRRRRVAGPAALHAGLAHQGPGPEARRVLTFPTGRVRARTSGRSSAA